jgi:hypothetical protein
MANWQEKLRKIVPYGIRRALCTYTGGLAQEDKEKDAQWRDVQTKHKEAILELRAVRIGLENAKKAVRARVDTFADITGVSRVTQRPSRPA